MIGAAGVGSCAMRCAECDCEDGEARGWIALLGREPEDEDAPIEVLCFCPVCAWHEFELARAAAPGYV